MPPQIITIDSLQKAKNRATGQDSATVARLALRAGFIPGQVVISPDGRAIASASSLYYRKDPNAPA